MSNPFLVLENRLSRIEELLLDLKYPATSSTIPPPTDEYLNLEESADFCNVAKQTMYQNIKKIPHYKRFGKLYFKRSELVAYLEAGAKN